MAQGTGRVEGRRLGVTSKARVGISEGRKLEVRQRQLQRRLNVGCDYIEEDTRKRGQKGKLIRSLETRTTSEGDMLTRSQGTSLTTLRGREMRRRGESKKLVRQLRDQTWRGAKQEIG